MGWTPPVLDSAVVRTVTNDVAGDREIRRRKELAVLCRSIMLKSPGAHLVSDPAAHYTIIANPHDQALLKPHVETVVVVDTTTNKPTPRLLYWSSTKRES